MGMGPMSKSTSLAIRFTYSELDVLCPRRGEIIFSAFKELLREKIRGALLGWYRHEFGDGFLDITRVALRKLRPTQRRSFLVEVSVSSRTGFLVDTYLYVFKSPPMGEIRETLAGDLERGERRYVK